MSIIEKLSDRNNFVFDAIKIVLVNEGMLSPKDLQYKLFQCGIYVKGSLLKQALSVMDQKGELTKPNAKPVQEPVQEESKA